VAYARYSTFEQIAGRLQHPVKADLGVILFRFRTLTHTHFLALFATLRPRPLRPHQLPALPHQLPGPPAPYTLRTRSTVLPELQRCSLLTPHICLAKGGSTPAQRLRLRPERPTFFLKARALERRLDRPVENRLDRQPPGGQAKFGECVTDGTRGKTRLDPKDVGLRAIELA
jgi:hypothetical protein